MLYSSKETTRACIIILSVGMTLCCSNSWTSLNNTFLVLYTLIEKIFPACMHGSQKKLFNVCERGTTYSKKQKASSDPNDYQDYKVVRNKVVHLNKIERLHETILQVVESQ